MNYAQYNPDLPHDPLTDDELDQLDRLLAALPTEGAMDLEALDGYLTALLIAPTLPRTETWMPEVWGGDGPDGPPFASGKQHKRCALLVLRWLAQLDRTLRQDPDSLEPLFGVAESGESQWVDAELWCGGFLHGLGVTADQWEGHLDDASVAVALRPIVLLGSEGLSAEDNSLVQTHEQRDQWSRQVPDAVTALYQHWRA